MHPVDWYSSRRVVLAAAAVLALILGAVTLVAVRPMGAEAAGDTLTKAQIKKLIKKEAKKHPGPQGPAGPPGPPGPTGSARVDTIASRATFGQGPVAAYAKNGLIITLTCSLSGSVTARSTSDNAAIANQALSGGSTIGGFVGDFDSGALNELALGSGGTNTIGTLVYSPAGGTPVTVTYDVQFSTAQENCILMGSATY